MKKITLALMFCAAVMAQAQTLDLPITFDNPNVNYFPVSFGNATHQIMADPTDPANNVLQQVKPAGAETWAGTVVGDSGIATPIPFAAGSTTISCRVWAATIGLVIRMKVEDRTNGTISVETEATTTVANGWSTLIFDFANQAPGTAPINFANTYNKVVVFSDFGNVGSGTTVYYDDIAFGSSTGLQQVDLPITFDDSNVDYNLVNFGDMQGAIVVDPTNSANQVLQQTKPAGAQTWAGTIVGNVGLATAIPFAAGSTVMQARVWSPDAGTPVLMKVEDATNGAIAVETFAYTTAAATWETLIFDFANNATGTPAINFANTYNKVVVFCDFGNPGSGKIFYVDNIKFGPNIGIDENQALNQISVYPNPSNGIITVGGQTEMATALTITVMDLNGRTLLTENHHAMGMFSQNIDLSHAAAGLYLVRVSSNQGTTTQRISITR